MSSPPPRTSSRSSSSGRPPAPGRRCDLTGRHYRLNLNRLSLGESVRHSSGVGRGILVWVLGRFGLLGSSDAGPQYMAGFDELDVEPTRLSDRCRELLRPLRDAFQGAGFEPVAYSQIPASADPSLLDCGSCHLLHRTGEAFSFIAHVNKLAPPRYDRSEALTVVSVTSPFASGRTITVTTSRAYLDPLPGSRVHVLKGAAPAALVQHLDARTRSARVAERPLRITTRAQLAAFVDAQQDKATQARVRRGLFVEMRPDEVAAARARIEQLRGAGGAG